MLEIDRLLGGRERLNRMALDEGGTLLCNQFPMSGAGILARGT